MSIFKSKTHGSGKFKRKVEKCFFIGSKKLGLDCLKQMHSLSPQTLKGVVTINDSHDGRSVLKDFIEYTKKSNLKLYIIKKRQEFDEIMFKFKPQFCLVVGWYWLISKDILDLVPYGIVGLHASLLPKYRGGAPLVWATINGEKEAGITMFYFSEGMDSGPIIAQKRISIETDDYINHILEKTEEKALALLEKYYPKILNKTVKTYDQNNDHATYCAQRYPEDGIVDWGKSAEEIYNFIRAQSKPYPGAFTFFRNKKLLLWQASLPKQIYFGTPGQVVNIIPNGVSVVCKDNKPIILESVQIEGDKVRPANEVIKSIMIRL